MKFRSLVVLISLPLVTACGEPADAITDQDFEQAEIVGQTYGRIQGRHDIRCLFNTIEFKEDGTVITTNENREDLNYKFHYVIKPPVKSNEVATIDLYEREEDKTERGPDYWFKLLDNGLLEFGDWTCAKLS